MREGRHRGRKWTERGAEARKEEGRKHARKDEIEEGKKEAIKEEIYDGRKKESRRERRNERIKISRKDGRTAGRIRKTDGRTEKY